jgi:hypothetical protein
VISHNDLPQSGAVRGEREHPLLDLQRSGIGVRSGVGDMRDAEAAQLRRDAGPVEDLVEIEHRPQPVTRAPELARALLLGCRARRQPLDCGGVQGPQRAAAVLSPNRPIRPNRMPALTSMPGTNDEWRDVEEWSRTVSARDAVERARLLGIAVGALAENRNARSPVANQDAICESWRVL